MKKILVKFTKNEHSFPLSNCYHKLLNEIQVLADRSLIKFITLLSKQTDKEVHFFWNIAFLRWNQAEMQFKLFK